MEPNLNKTASLSKEKMYDLGPTRQHSEDDVIGNSVKTWKSSPEIETALVHANDKKQLKTINRMKVIALMPQTKAEFYAKINHDNTRSYF